MSTIRQLTSQEIATLNTYKIDYSAGSRVDEIRSYAKSHFCGLLETEINGKAGLPFTIQSRSVQVQLPVIQNQAANTFVNSTLPLTVTNMIDQLQGINFCPVHENGRPRVVDRTEFDTLCLSLGGLSIDYGTHKRVGGFHQAFLLRISPFLTNLATRLKGALFEGERIKNRIFSSNDCTMTVDELANKYICDSWKISALQDSPKEIVELIFTVFNFNGSPEREKRILTPDERKALTFLLDMVNASYGTTFMLPRQ